MSPNSNASFTTLLILIFYKISIVVNIMIFVMHYQNTESPIFTNYFLAFTEMREKPIYADLSLV